MAPGEKSIDLDFKDNRLLPLLFGERDRHLNRIELSLGVSIRARGNHVTITGSPAEVATAQTVLSRLYERLQDGQMLTVSDIEGMLRLARPTPKKPTNGSTPLPEATPEENELAIATRRKVILPRTPGQIDYIKMLQTYDLVFGLGPAGTGKTYLATAMAVSDLLMGKVERIVLSRPAVEAGEKLGFLPGDLKEKVDPYLRPLYDALFDMLPQDQVEKRLLTGEIEVAPLAFMRGRTLSRSFVILDEAQNTTVEQIKMFLTRLGEDSKMVVTGDLTQIDLPKGTKSGLVDALDVLNGTPDIGFCHLKDTDVLRHPLVSKIVRAYNRIN